MADLGSDFIAAFEDAVGITFWDEAPEELMPNLPTPGRSLTDWRFTYNGDSKGTVDAPHPRRAGKRFTLAEVEHFSAELTERAGRLIAAAPETPGALRDLMKAIDELLTEFVSKKRAANWGVINDAMVKANGLLARIEGQS